MIRLRQIKINYQEDTKSNILKEISIRLHIKEQEIIDYKINKKSIDARKKPIIYFVYEIDVTVNNEEELLKKYSSINILKTPNEIYQYKPTGSKSLSTRPIIVGMGPCGLFAALMLAKDGYKPLIIERGKKVEDRIKDVNDFWDNNKLNEESNVQFGEGGAGTFSDGKLNTLVNDANYRQKYIFETFVKHGAPESILYDSHPHIGTDILSKVISSIREEIISLGGEIRFNTKLTNIKIENNTLKQIEINNNEWLDAEVLVLAIGHSARDTFKILLDNNVPMQPKPFALGIRIIEDQHTINMAQYKTDDLGPANYKLTYQTKEKRGVYTFCMCPGGYVVNSSSQKNHLAINGMSYNKRDSKCANSALIVTVSPSDYGTNVLDGLNFQKELEQKAYELGDGYIPLELTTDYLTNKTPVSLGNLKPMIKGNYKIANLNDLFPSYINNALHEALPALNNKLHGFADDKTIIAGVETRTSSPIRIVRNDDFVSSINGLYPAGEGAGYAGGITSSAMDGIKVSEAITRIYRKD